MRMLSRQAISALHAKNLPTLARRMGDALAHARRRLEGEQGGGGDASRPRRTDQLGDPGNLLGDPNKRSRRRQRRAQHLEGT